MVAMRANVPPVKCTTPDPAKSMQPIPHEQSLPGVECDRYTGDDDAAPDDADEDVSVLQVLERGNAYQENLVSMMTKM
jgi:hypothetical protein